MAIGASIHIGLDHVDPAGYGGWDGSLDACENDALAIEVLARNAGYRHRTLLTEAATASAVFTAIADEASTLQDGDICLITYAGHGGQFADLNADEPDALDETWLLYDREVLDDEIRNALAAFRSGVRVVVLSDSCHSGTVVRAMYEALIRDVPSIRSAYSRAAPGPFAWSGVAGRGVRLRGAPPAIQRKVLSAHRAAYQRIRVRTPRRGEIAFEASLILISGCQDNQESAEENGHGVFTAALLKHWEGGAFTGDYRMLHEAIRRDLPPTQSPNFFTEGRPWPAFERQRPFTIDPPTEPIVNGGHQGSNSGSIGGVDIQFVEAEANVVVIKFRR
jgi:hypothetical protein